MAAHRGHTDVLRCLVSVWVCAAQVSCDPTPRSEPHDVLIIALDTIRWDATDLAGAPSGLTPNLAAFADLPGSVTFSRAYTDAAWSQPAYMSLLTGQQALTHGVGFLRSALVDGQATVATMFQAHGYETRAFASGPHLAPISGISSGFDDYIHSLDQRTIGIQVGPALEWLQQPRTEGRPRFGFIHGYDAHAPYGAPAVLSDPFQPDGTPLQNSCMVPGFRCYPPGVMSNSGHTLTPDAQASLQCIAGRLDVQIGRALLDGQAEQIVERPHDRRAAREITQIVEIILTGAGRGLRGIARLIRLEPQRQCGFEIVGGRGRKRDRPAQHEFDRSQRLFVNRGSHCQT